MKILIGSDHAGFELKNVLKAHLEEKGFLVEDFGAKSFDKDDDYPAILTPLAFKIAEDPENTRGIVIGASGQGEAMCANRFPGVRCALYYGSVAKEQTDASGNVFNMLASVRQHNNSNMLSLAARFLDEKEAKEAVDLWLATPFSNEERHIRRNEMLDNIQ